MNGYINGFSLNGAAYPSWVVRAVVVAAAAATVAVAPTRITFASAFGDAAVSVSLTQTHTIQARATGYADCTVNLQPTLIYAGASVATATATGNGAVRRDVFATAGGDATCTGEALVAQALGEATTTAISTVDLALAHIIHPGRAVVLCEADVATASGDVTRYPTVGAGLGRVIYTRGEASIQRSGNAYVDHDGFVVDASGTATVTIEPDRVKIIATFGSFEYCDANGSATPFIRYSARALGTGVITAQSVVAVHNHRPTALATAEATGTATAVRGVLPSAAGVAEADSYLPRARINHTARALGEGEAVGAVSPLRTAMAVALGVGEAALAAPIRYGVQHFSGATWNGEATGTGHATYRVAARAVATSGAESYGVTFGRQQWGDIGVATATATAGMPTPTQIKHAFASGTGTAAAMALAFANSDKLAPDDRYMVVSQDERDMIVLQEERTMVVMA